MYFLFLFKEISNYCFLNTFHLIKIIKKTPKNKKKLINFFFKITKKKGTIWIKNH